VVSHNTRWITTSEDSAGVDQDTYETTFEKLSELCDTKDINPLDVLEIAMTVSNEMVKHKKTFNKKKDQISLTTKPNRQVEVILRPKAI